MYNIRNLGVALLLGLVASPELVSLAEANPCAAKNPCAANPCAANPCGGGSAAAQTGKAVTVVGDIVQGNQSGKFVVRANGKRIGLTLSDYAVVREGPKVVNKRNITPGREVTVSYVDVGRDKTAWYVYLAAAGAIANPCGGANPCAATSLGVAQRNPCAAKTINPCEKRLNPCADKTLNPCAAKTLNPCAAKTLNPRTAETLNPCATK